MRLLDRSTFVFMVVMMIAFITYNWSSTEQSFQETRNFVMITDLDIHSKDRSSWHSHLHRGSIHYHKKTNKYSIHVSDDKSTRYTSQISRNQRGMELSCLTLWNGKLYSVCDYTGILYELDNNEKAIPRYVLTTGNGTGNVVLKSEWCTVDKENRLVVGSIGKEWVLPDGSIDLDRSMEWVNRIYSLDSVAGIVRILLRWLFYDVQSTLVHHEHWERVYQLIRQKTNTTLPGYIIHESVLYDRELNKWVFLPRKASHQVPYSEKSDETMATNMLIFVKEPILSATLADIQVKFIGEKDVRVGYTDIAKIPGTKSHYIATRVVEIEDEPIETYLTIFDSNGDIISDPKYTRVPGNFKFEGIEVL